MQRLHILHKLRQTLEERLLTRSVALSVTPASPWYVGEEITLKATVTEDGAPVVGELVRFDIIVYVNGSIAYDLPNGTTDSSGVATITWVIPETRNSTVIADQDVAFRAFDNTTMTQSNYVYGHVYSTLAHLTRLIISCIQPDGTWAGFDILAGQTPSAIPGTGNLQFTVGAIQAQNVGEIQATLYIKVTDDTGAEIYYIEAVVDPGGYIANTTVTFDMPPRNYGITVEVGHI